MTRLSGGPEDVKLEDFLLGNWGGGGSKYFLQEVHKKECSVDLPGINVPTVYIGSEYATFNPHVEDQFLSFTSPYPKKWANL